MPRSHEPSASSSATVETIHEGIEGLRDQAASIQRSIEQTRALLRESRAAMNRASELMTYRDLGSPSRESDR